MLNDWNAMSPTSLHMCLRQRPNDHGHATPHTDFLLQVCGRTRRWVGDGLYEAARM